jgi:replication-associated recombination protein RarA
MVDTFTVKEGGERFSNFYFRHAPGTGKTVLLKLFGRELQQRGFAVFMLSAPELDDYRTGFFETLVDRLVRDGKEVAVLVDEVHRNVNSAHWGYLLKKASPKLLVVGAGNSGLLEATPQFLKKIPSDHRPAIGQLTEEDMPEVLSHFIPQGADDAQWAVKAQALNELLVASGGQVYPFVTIAKHLMKSDGMQHLSNVSAYLTSKAFYNSEDYERVRLRCYDLADIHLDKVARFLLEQPFDESDRSYALKTGLWNGTKFVSPLLVQEIFRQLERRRRKRPSSQCG